MTEKTLQPLHAPTLMPEDNFAGKLRFVVREADKVVARHLADHRDAMHGSRTMDYLRSKIAFQPNDVTADDVIYRVGRQKAYFEEEALPQVRDMQGFYEACIAFVDVQMEQLFFYNNDVLTAHITRDYLRSVVEGMRSALMKRGTLNPEDAAKLDRILAYEQLGLRSYEALAKTLLKGGDDPSIISVALQALQVPLRDEHGAVIETPTPYLQDVRDCFGAMVRRTGLAAKEGFDVPPMMMVMATTLREIAQEETAHTLGETPKKHARVITDKIESHFMHKAMREISAATRGAIDHAEELLKAQACADGLLQKAKRLPEGMDEKLQAIHTLAMLEGEKALRTSPHPGTPKFAPTSQWMKQEAGFGTLQRAHVHWKELDKDLRTPLREAMMPDAVLNVLDNAVDDSAMRLMYEGMEPKVLDALKAYVRTVRREMGKLLFGTPGYNEEALLKMSHVERKCDLAIESYYAMMPWMMDHTDGAYDDCYLSAMAKTQATLGKPISKFDEDDYRFAAQEGRQTFVDAIKNQGIYLAKNESPFVPALFARCEHLAALRDARDATSSHDPMDVRMKAQDMFYALMDSSHAC